MNNRPNRPANQPQTANCNYSFNFNSILYWLEKHRLRLPATALLNQQLNVVNHLQFSPVSTPRLFSSISSFFSIFYHFLFFFLLKLYSNFHFHFIFSSSFPRVSLLFIPSSSFLIIFFTVSYNERIRSVEKENKKI